MTKLTKLHLTKKEIEELTSSVERNLGKCRGLADNPEFYLSVNSDGSVRKNSSYTPKMVAEARERKIFLEGLLTKLNKL